MHYQTEKSYEQGHFEALYDVQRQLRHCQNTLKPVQPCLNEVFDN